MSLMSTGDVLNRSAYNRLLATQEWKDYSAKVRAARGNACECCKLGGKETQIHHLFYDGRNPWEYDFDDVVLLCKTCHEQVHEQLKVFRKMVFRKLNGNTFKILNAALFIGLYNYEPLIFVHALMEFSKNKRLVENHAKVWGLDANGKPIES